MNVFKRLVLREATLDFLKKHWGAIVSIGGPLLAFLEPSLHAYASSNPKSSLGVVIGALLTMYYSRSPKDKNSANTNS
jgi:hypothetical protein